MGLLTTAGSWISGMFGRASSPVPRDPRDSYPVEEYPRDVEKMHAGPAGIKLPAFLPYYDARQNVGETQAMRSAYRVMLNDPNIASSFRSQILSVAALDLHVRPPGKQPRTGPPGMAKAWLRQVEIAEFVRWNLMDRQQGGLPGMIWSILSGALIDGYSVCEKVWARQEQGKWAGKWVLDALKPKDPDQDLVLILDSFKNVVGLQGLRYNAGQTFDPKDFLIFTHFPLFGNPTGVSLFRAVYSRYWFLDTAVKLRAMLGEKKSTPVVAGEFPSPDKKAALITALASIKSSNWLAVPAETKLQLLDLAGSGPDFFRNWCQDLREEIVFGITGATLQVMAGSEGQQRGDTKIHESSSNKGPWFYSAQLMWHLNDPEHGLIRDLVNVNFQGETALSRATLGGVDDAEQGESLKIVQGLKQIGFNISKSSVADRFGWDEAEGPEDELTPPSQGPPGWPGGGLAGAPPKPPPEGQGPPAPPPKAPAPAPKPARFSEGADQARDERGRWKKEYGAARKALDRHFDRRPSIIANHPAEEALRDHLDRVANPDYGSAPADRLADAHALAAHLERHADTLAGVDTRRGIVPGTDGHEGFEARAFDRGYRREYAAAPAHLRQTAQHARAIADLLARRLGAQAFAEHDVSGEARAADGKWTAGGAGGHAAAHLAAAHAWLKDAPLPPERKEEYAGHMAGVLGKMPGPCRKAALEALDDIAGGVRFHPDLASVKAALEKTTGKKEQGVVGGFVEQRPGGDVVRMHVDGGVPGSAKDDETAQGIYAHELGHAVDAGRRYSADPKWQSAWKGEIFNGKTLLSKYARTSATEGFAELHRALVQKGVEATAKAYPKCCAYLKAKGLLDAAPATFAERAAYDAGADGSFLGELFGRAVDEGGVLGDILLGGEGHDEFAEPEGDDNAERAGLIADILGGTAGEQARLAFSEAAHECFAEGKWDALHHPRGKDGRFVKRGSAEAVRTAHAALADLRKLHPSRENVRKAAEHLSILTVAQLRQLKKAHGLAVSGKLREDLIRNLSERLPGAKPQIYAQQPERAADAKLTAYRQAAAALEGKGELHEEDRELLRRLKAKIAERQPEQTSAAPAGEPGGGSATKGGLTAEAPDHAALLHEYQALANKERTTPAENSRIEELNRQLDAGQPTHAPGPSQFRPKPAAPPPKPLNTHERLVREDLAAGKDPSGYAPQWRQEFPQLAAQHPEKTKAPAFPATPPAPKIDLPQHDRNDAAGAVTVRKRPSPAAVQPVAPAAGAPPAPRPVASPTLTGASKQSPSSALPPPKNPGNSAPATEKPLDARGQTATMNSGVANSTGAGRETNMKRLTPKTDLSKWTDAELKARLDVEVAKLNKHRLGVSDVSAGHAIEAELSAKQLGAEIQRRRGAPANTPAEPGRGRRVGR